MLGAAALSAVLLAASDAGAADKIAIIVGGMEKQIYLPPVLCEKLGFFKEQGLDVELINSRAGVEAENELLAGAVQGVVGFYDHTIDLQAKGKSIISIVQLSQAPGEVEMLSSKHGDIKSPADLKGKTLGVTGLGSSTDFLTQFIATRAGLKPGEFSLLPVGAGTDVPIPTSDCDDTSCHNGTQAHAFTKHPLGAPCSTFMGNKPGSCDGMGNCIQCTMNSQCTGTGTTTDCQHPICNTTTLTCAAAFTPAGTPTTMSPPQVPGICKQIVCDGNGGTTTKTDDTNVPPTLNPCVTNKCVNGTLTTTNNVGMPCGSGQTVDHCVERVAPNADTRRQSLISRCHASNCAALTK